MMKKKCCGLMVQMLIIVFFSSCNEAKKTSICDNIPILEVKDSYKGPYTSITDSLIKTGRQCPSCHGDSIAAIEYGLVTKEEMENIDSLENELRKRKHVLGGCDISTDSPRYYCYKCQRRW